VSLSAGCDIPEEVDVGALIAVAFLILYKARLQEMEGGKMIHQVLERKIVGRPARLAFKSVFLNLPPFATALFPFRKDSEKKDPSGLKLSGAVIDDGLAVSGIKEMEKVEAIHGVIEVVAERHVKDRAQKIMDLGIGAGGETDGDVGDLNAVNGQSLRGKKIRVATIAGTRDKEFPHPFPPEEFHRLDSRPAGRAAPDPSLLFKPPVPIVLHSRLHASDMGGIYLFLPLSSRGILEFPWTAGFSPSKTLRQNRKDRLT